MTIFSEVMVILVVRNEHVLGDTLAYSKQSVEAIWHQKHPFSCNLASDLQNVRNPNGRVRTAYLADRRLKTPQLPRDRIISKIKLLK